jgi:hypothetical protein
MSDAAGISNLQAGSLALEISTRIARKALDVTKQQGASAISLLEQAAQLSDELNGQAGGLEPHKGARIDVKA